jgi:chorismate mutase/prephenate dehydratase
MKKMAQLDLQKLKKRRKEIDFIDRRLLGLLNQRLHIALEIGEIKKEMGEKIYDPEREKAILEGLKIVNQGPLKEQDLKKIFKTIMRVSRRSQS